MSTMAESKVAGIIQSLSGLEDDLDSLNNKVADMKKQLSLKAQTKIDNLLEKTREMATKEAEVIINATFDSAIVLIVPKIPSILYLNHSFFEFLDTNLEH